MAENSEINDSERYTTADALLEVLQEMGVSYLFSNLGSDHSSIIEGLAKARSKNIPLPEVIICPHEQVALAAAHGYALISQKAQAVLVHCDVGTQSMGGAVHNISRARVPAFIFAGETPYTLEKELRGTRNRHVNFLQDVHDQRGIVRPYVKWEYDIRTGRNVKQLVSRALQLAHSEPCGPVYLTGAREVLEEEVEPVSIPTNKWSPTEPSTITAHAVEEIVSALAGAKNPLILTSYLGRKKETVYELIQFSESLGIPVIEQHASYTNFPGDHPLHLGFQEGKFLSQADVILVLDNDVPWLASLNQPSEDAQIYYVDMDPLKEDLPLWYMPSHKFFKADSYEVLKQFNECVQNKHVDQTLVRERYQYFKNIHDEQRAQWEQERMSDDGVITPAMLTTCIQELIDEDTIVIDESGTNIGNVNKYLPRTKPGTLFRKGGTSLGWNGGAALGVKLAAPEKTVVNLTADGSYLLSVPSTVHWMSRKYNAPFLTVIYNNQGWNATKENVLRLYPDGMAGQHDRFWVNFDQPADLAKIAEAAGGAYAQTVQDPRELKEVLTAALHEVKNNRSAVIDVRLPPISKQTD
ncbi:thiamine pyrophosphate-requiring protein [Bacillus sp. Marseille-P3661]|uniref:thiamine pyrophosphate-requiring protein n=1 Tax=Bacillus sp. Marseille-P3661 TaxID=1936234 RepID=UPI000C83449D|nr:thiamine pyrophosphate-requiring protein [Bacillus sp. Marseille-P3661]